MCIFWRDRPGEPAEHAGARDVTPTAVQCGVGLRGLLTYKKLGRKGFFNLFFANEESALLGVAMRRDQPQAGDVASW